ncbi:hypothetical protein [Croceibacterium aestuarii]|uniref:hypothetical protein n=1 Tax=Croceibacterium aestuarii TaxID=3064139 RepID=UPI00272E9F37|nr:hypothetical protein [Croceibacterium sp. D39]
MTHHINALAASDVIVLEPNDRPPILTIPRIASMALSVFVLFMAAYQMRSLKLSDITAIVPGSLLFWAVFAASYLAGPLSDWIIFRRLWKCGASAFGALLRKLIYNELLVGYLGEVYFYSWARRKLALAASPFGAVKDVAVLSALTGNIVTLLVLALASPFLRLLPLDDYAATIAWSLAFVIGTSVAVMIWRGRIFSLSRPELWFVAVVQVLRIVVSTLLSGLLWHLVLPEVALAWWLLLAALRLLISRLPFVPNKDIVFAGVAILVVGKDAEMAALVTMMAGLILLTHILIGVTFALVDLFDGDRNAKAAC